MVNRGESMHIDKETLSSVNANPLYQATGIRVEEASEGKARCRLEPTHMDCWPTAGQPHGGILFTLMDTTMAWAVISKLDPGANCATVQSDIHYMKPASGTLFFCSARVTHQSKRLSFVQAEIHDSNDNLLSSGQATFANLVGR